MRYVAYDPLHGRPNIVVDGSPTAGTVLTLSHWPRSGTPRPLLRDLSAESAFAYLADPTPWPAAELVSNNHLDEDGVVGLYALVAPEHACAHRDRLIEVARAGDFTTTTDRAAARIAFAISTLVAAGAGYDEVLAQLPALVDDVGAFESLWAEEDERLEAGIATPFDVEEIADLDLAVVTVASAAPLHPIAVHNSAAGFTVLTLAPGNPVIEQRYEGWVQHRSRRPRPRRDLRPLARELTARDSATWIAGAPSDLVPICRPATPSDLDPAVIRTMLIEHLRGAPPAWDPYG